MQQTVSAKKVIVCSDVILFCFYCFLNRLACLNVRYAGQKCYKRTPLGIKSTTCQSFNLSSVKINYQSQVPIYIHLRKYFAHLKPC